MTKCGDQPGWISDIKKNIVLHLEAAGVSLIEEDIILTISPGLPEEYLAFIVALDSIPPNEFILSNVTTQLLNKEVGQDPLLIEKQEARCYNDSGLAAAAKHKKRLMEEVTCYDLAG